MKNIYYKIKSIVLFLLITAINILAQVPIQYYDFELNSDRSIGEVTSEIIINPVAVNDIISVGGELETVPGNPPSGRAIRRNDWDENGVINPGINALDYIEFSASTDGFAEIFVKADASASNGLQPNGKINLLYSFDGGSTFNQSTPQELTSSFVEYNWNLSEIIQLNNNPDIKFRLYAYGDVTPTGNGTLVIDNLFVSANRIISSKILGDYQLINEANGSAPFPVFENFIVDGAGIIVNIQSDLRVNNNLTLNEGIIVTGDYKVVMVHSADIQGASIMSYVANSFGYFFDLEDSTGSGLSRDATLIFPVGSLAGFRPVTLNFDDINEGEESGEIIISQVDENPFPASLPASVENISNIRFWRLLSSFNSFEDIDIKLEWADDDGVSDLENVTVVYGTAGGAWTDEDNSGGFGGSMNSGFVIGNFDEVQPRDFTFGNLAGGGNALPVELSSFTGRVINNVVYLSWRTETEVNSFRFIIERMSSENMLWKNIGQVAASGNSNSPQYYSFNDNIVDGGLYSYRLKMIDNDGSFNYSYELHFEIKGENSFELYQNYPNPFNPSTIINYKLPEKSFVSLKIYNILGNEITTIINEEKQAGEHSVEFDVNNLSKELSNGTYFYILKAGDYTQTRKMVYIK